MIASTCRICQKSFEYPELGGVLGVNISDYKAPVCSTQCETHARALAQREDFKKTFNRILSVMPDAYKGVKMSDFDEMELIHGQSKNKSKGTKDIIERFCNSDYWNISLHSPITGNGKTRLGLYILACLSLKGIYRGSGVGNIQEAGYYSAIDISKLLKTETFDSKQYHLQRFYNARVLMIDDLGQESGQSSHDDIASIIKIREENKRKTIITFNNTKEDLEKKYSARVYSRISKGLFIVMGQDRRLEK